MESSGASRILFPQIDVLCTVRDDLSDRPDLAAARCKIAQDSEKINFHYHLITECIPIFFSGRTIAHCTKLY